MNQKEAEDRERLEKMTMKEIKAVAKDEGISLGYDGSRKENAIGSILEWRRFKGCYMERY
nr:MAG TPA: HeH/LEM domain [Caudoviricetes sp.]